MAFSFLVTYTVHILLDCYCLLLFGLLTNIHIPFEKHYYHFAAYVSAFCCLGLSGMMVGMGDDGYGYGI
jgi:hypothetical protein